MRLTSPSLEDRTWESPVFSIVCWVSTRCSSYVSSLSFFFFSSHSLTITNPSLIVYFFLFLPHTNPFNLSQTHSLSHIYMLIFTHFSRLSYLTSSHLILFLISHSSGTDRSIVSDVAGTTRDTVDALVVRYTRSGFVYTLNPSYFFICFIHSISSKS